MGTPLPDAFGHRVTGESPAPVAALTRPTLSEPAASVGGMATAEDVRRLALALPRAYEALVGDRVKFRVGRLVFLSLSPDEKLLGFGFPKEERAALVASDPDKFLMPLASDERYHWARLRLARIGQAELAELVVDAWRMVVPRRVAEAYLRSGRAPVAPADGLPAALALFAGAGDSADGGRHGEP
jgi:hypothetical protein